MKTPKPEEIQNLLTLVNAGDPIKALAPARRFAAAYPDAGLSHLMLGVALIGANKFDAAVDSLRIARRMSPEDASVLNYMGFVLDKLGRSLEAAECYEVLLKMRPDSVAVKDSIVACYDVAAGAAFESGDFESAAKLYGMMADLRPASDTILYLGGVSLYRAGRWPEAQVALSKCIDIKPDKIQALAAYAIVEKVLGRPYEDVLRRILDIPAEGLKNISTKMWAALMVGDAERAFCFDLPGLNVMRWRDLDTLYRRADLQGRLKAALPAVSGTWPYQNARPLIFAGGDGNYAEKFARDLISSALEKCPGCDFHLHLMNPGRFDPDKAFAAFPRHRLTWTVEDMGLVDKIFFSSRRWLRLAQLQYDVERPIALVDTDSVFNGDIFAALPEKFDVVISDRWDEPWIHQSANGAFLAVSPRGRDFTDFLADYILHYTELGIQKWFDEQLNIVAASAWFARNVPNMVINHAPKHMMDWTGVRDAKCLIWHSKGKLKKKPASGP